jgi:hypothetical protein
VLEITWALPPLFCFYTAKPTVYCEHLIGHEGPGRCVCLCARVRLRQLTLGASLLSLLKKRELATALSAGVAAPSAPAYAPTRALH